MMRSGALVFALFWVVILTGCQAKPDFSGRWLVVGNASQSRTVDGRTIDFSSSLGAESIAQQDPKAVTFSDPEGSILVSAALDGSETRQRLPRETNRELVWSATWDGPKLVIMSRVEPPRGTEAAVKQVLSIDSTGALILEYQQTPTWPVVTFAYKRATAEGNRAQ